MIRELKQIEYRHGMIAHGTPEKDFNTADLDLLSWQESNIPAEISKAIDEESLLDLGGVYGDKALGDPIEYDHLRLVLVDESIEIIVFNRGITLFTTDDERVRRIHRALCKMLFWEKDG